jgi:DNA repair exonuclease SbcCD ATPase subunit
LLKVQLNSIETELLTLKQIDVVEDKKTIQDIINSNKESLPDNILNLVETEDEIEDMYQKYKQIYTDNNYKKFISFSEIENLEEEEIPTIEKKIVSLESKKQPVNFSADITNEYIKAKKIIKTYDTQDKLDLDKIKEIIENLSPIDDGYFICSESRTDILKDLTKEYVDPSTYLKYKKIIEDKETRDKAMNSNIIIDGHINKLKKLLKNTIINTAHFYRNGLNKLSSQLEYIDTYHENIELLGKLSILDSNVNINSLLERKHSYTTNIERLNISILTNTKLLSSYEGKLQTFDKLAFQKSELDPVLSSDEKSLLIYKTYIDITHSKNLPKILISNIVKNICTEANKLIYNTTGLLCDIQENEKWEIVIKKQDVSVGPMHCSGYERFIINTSLKLTFDKYKQLSSIKLFLIDEVIDCVSEDNFDQIDLVFDFLQKHYKKIIIISHNEELKKKVNHRINIHLDGKISSIC